MRYHFKFVIRPDTLLSFEDYSERAIEGRITAETEYLARRLILERAWAQGLLISRFTSVWKVSQ